MPEPRETHAAGVDRRNAERVTGRCPEHHLTFCEPCGWVDPATARDLAATVQRVRALCDEWERLAAGNEEARGKPTAVAGYYRRHAAVLRAALAPSDPATDTGGEAT